MSVILSAKELVLAREAALSTDEECQEIYATLSHVFAWQVREPLIGTHVGQQLAGNGSHSYLACWQLTVVCCFTARGRRPRRFFF